MRICFASDVHLGAPYIVDHREHEMRFVRWLDAQRGQTDELYLLGDIFDYWYEYKTVVPRGYVRTLGKLAQLTDEGVRVHIFAGNHDAWVSDYLSEECGLEVHEYGYEFVSCGKRFEVGHGDNFGYDKVYSAMMWCFHNRFLQGCYSLLHPDFAGWIARTWSKTSRKGNEKAVEMHSFRGPEKEYQVRYAVARDATGRGADYYIFGHRHIVADYSLREGGPRVLIIGDWVKNFSYAVFDGNDVKIERW